MWWPSVHIPLFPEITTLVTISGGPSDIYKILIDLTSAANKLQKVWKHIVGNGRDWKKKFAVVLERDTKKIFNL